MAFLLEAEIWVAVAFLIFIGVLIYVGVPKHADRTRSTTAPSACRPSSTRRAG